jgi:putative salt-induced outer membrane protein YdiY
MSSLSKKMNTNNIIRKATRWLLTCAIVATTGFMAKAQDAENVEEKEKTQWETNASVGFTLTQGNNDTLLATASILGLKKWELNELSLGADASIGEVEGVKNNETLRGNAQYNRLFTNDRTFALLNVSALHDAIADVEYRGTISPGLGHYFFKEDKFELSADLGPGCVYEKVGGITDHYMSLRAAESAKYKISDRARLWQKIEYIPQVDNFENYLVTAEIGIDSDLTEKLGMRFTIQDVYDNEPAAGRKSNDLRVVSSLRYKF